MSFFMEVEFKTICYSNPMNVEQMGWGLQVFFVGLVPLGGF
jgi:hypothetical protein